MAPRADSADFRGIPPERGSPLVDRQLDRNGSRIRLWALAAIIWDRHLDFTASGNTASLPDIDMRYAVLLLGISDVFHDASDDPSRFPPMSGRAGDLPNSNSAHLCLSLTYGPARGVMGN